MVVSLARHRSIKGLIKPYWKEGWSQRGKMCLGEAEIFEEWWDEGSKRT